MAKAPKETFFLVSSEGTGFFYTNRKNKKKGKGETKLKVRKYDPVARKHVVFEDRKLSKLKKKYVAGAQTPADSAEEKAAKAE
jgi:large subunit ribosomal protein L33